MSHEELTKYLRCNDTRMSLVERLREKLRVALAVAQLFGLWILYMSLLSNSASDDPWRAICRQEASPGVPSFRPSTRGYSQVRPSNP